MELLNLNASELSWELDFDPQDRFSNLYPIFAARLHDKIVALTGFEKRQSLEPLKVMVLESPPEIALREIWEKQIRGPIEKLRFQKVLGQRSGEDFLFEYPIALLHSFDSKLVPIKCLTPLKYLMEWKDVLSTSFLTLKPSSSQIRELIDLLCDLKLMKANWTDISPRSNTADEWLNHLRKKRMPMTTDSDQSRSDAVQGLPWPRGVMARWERRGDSSGMTITATVRSKTEWNKLQETIGTLDVGDQIWTQ